ncbi:MAG: hydrogenase 4 subunit B [Rhodospirillales bacterium RIFCSPLOWO2_12_FULL_58_28]|nr:MAG: hydrogenase 4 subunit B [Rhodospirillales bacterium RIFCSPLOWO2_02_FULL_58_16]OHC77660.1 MAG: hydrogenase 4 subunit B [Rhodospirillales bacterium RIFCSPLOWO2_12_FULL_58_28]
MNYLLSVMGGAALLFSLGIAACAVRPNREWIRFVYGLSAVISVVLLVGAVLALFSSGVPSKVVLPIGLPWVGSHFRLDALSAFFLIVVNLGSAAAGLYAMGYGIHEMQPRRVLPFFPAFLAAMNLVVIADDAFTFLVFWEVMSLTSWALVMSNHRDPETAKAGFLYFIMAGFGAFMLLFAFGILAGADGGYAFDAIREHDRPLWAGAAILTLALLGAGSKAGLFPLHVWLPLAHPAAPSHVSALLSGVMTKVAVYGFIRIIFDLAGSELVWWWSIPILIVGGITAAIGILYALMQDDLKRLLAYSSVENIGIIFIGLGLAAAFHANRLEAGAAVAMTAALLHVFNHSLFKNLLFLGAGAVLHATGERNLDCLGGLIHKMPVTAFLFLVGSIAISALPPFNGFVSEWLIFQSILVSPELPQAVLTFLVPAIGALLALSAALAATCFVKAFGIAFLGRPRTPQAETAHETDGYSLAAMGILAFLCLVFGVLPTLAVTSMGPVTQELVFAVLPAQGGGPAPLALIPFSSAKSSYDGFTIMAFLLTAGSFTAWFIHRFASRAVRRGPAWDCGTPADSTAGQYTSGGFSQPIRRVFCSVVFRAREEVDMPAPGDVGAARIKIIITDPAWALIFTPVASLLERISNRLNFLQFLTIRRYLSLMFAALITLLIVVVIWR